MPQENPAQQRTPQAGTFKVAAIQMASGPNVMGNLNEARRLIAKAAEQGARLVVLPEFFAIMGMSELAQRTGLSRESLYNTLSENGNPRFSNLVEILHALGLELSVRPRGRAA